MVRHLFHSISFVALSFPVLVLVPSALAQAPSEATIVLSLRTISKALAGCRETYTQIWPGAKQPMIKEILGAEAYEKDMSTLGNAEKIINTLIASPEKISGEGLVWVLSLSDDFAVGAASTQASLLMSLIQVHFDGNSDSAKQILLSASALGGCQRALFNAGDDYVSLVMRYVGAEDAALNARSPTQR